MTRDIKVTLTYAESRTFTRPCAAGDHGHCPRYVCGHPCACTQCDHKDR